MTRIITDTASDITEAEAKALQIQLVALPITFDDGAYDPLQDTDFVQFYDRLTHSSALPRTSLATPDQYLDIFSAAQAANDDVLVITLSSGLSGTYGAAQTAKEISEYAPIVVVDSCQATLAQRMLVYYAVRLRAQGDNAQTIAEKLEAVKERIIVCGVVDTLTYLKKGGRIPPALAFIGNAFHIKPVIILKDKKLELLSKAKGFKQGIKRLYEEFEKEPRDEAWPVFFGYANDAETGQRFMEETAAKYQLTQPALYPIGSVIGTHIGPGCVVIAFVRA